MRSLRRFIVNRKRTTLPTKLRRKRFALFKTLISTVPRPVRILDVGGTQSFWETMGFTGADDAEIVLFNLSGIEVTQPNFKCIVGDARDLSRFNDNDYDVVFSNSLIEHVGGFDDQRRCAEELRRVGRRYFVQTPNYYFPIEPHFLFPFFQYLPVGFRVFLVRHFSLGWYEKIPDLKLARQAVGRIRLLSERELRELFPGAAVHKEKFLGLTKSFMVCGGWEKI